jgi:flavin-binding protein dodecin
MSDQSYKPVEVVGSSTARTDGAIRQSIETAAETLRHIEWLEVTETRGRLVEANASHFQVTSKACLRLDL